MCTLPIAAEIKILSTKIQEKRWENRVSGLKTISCLAGLGGNIDGHEQLMQHHLYLLLIVALATDRNWIKWTDLRLPGNLHAANSQIFRELGL